MPIDQAVLTEYDTIVCVDRSGSMSAKTSRFPSRWKEAQELTLGIASLASQVDTDGITVIQFGGGFKASRDVMDGVTTDAVAEVFNKNTPAGSTPLHEALGAAFAKHDSAGKKAVIFVVTDGEPDSQDAVKDAIMAKAGKLDSADQCRVLFLQVGDDAAAAKYLNALDNQLTGAKFDIVNAIDFTGANNLTPMELYERAISDSH